MILGTDFYMYMQYVVLYTVGTGYKQQINQLVASTASFLFRKIQ